MRTCITQNSPDTNPEIDQDRVFDTVDHFRKFGYILFPQQISVYKNIARRIKGKTVIETGCGNCVGTSILERATEGLIATDKLKDNLKFAECLYPWMYFCVWDINNPCPFSQKVQHVVCIETIEHIANPQAAVQNLIDVATEGVWISTPNGKDKKRPPENPYHVCEYTPSEMVLMINNCWQKINVEILHWETFKPLDLDTTVDPLVYRIKLL